MVASRFASSPLLAQEDTPNVEAPLFDRYTRPIDRRAAGVEGGGGAATLVPLSFHESFKSRRTLSSAERKELAIKQAALRIAAGLEPRSLRELASDIGCSHTAIDNMVARFCERLGLRKFHVSDATRQRLRAARERQAQLRAEARQ
jgi:hypothetical protein